MAKVSILAILGYNGKERNEEKFQKLLCEGLVTALGNLAPEVDAALATASSPSPSPQKTEEYGTSVTQTLSSGCHVRVLLQPKIAQFQAAFNEAVQTAVQAGPGSTIAVVYAGQVLHSTGEWILADSTFSGSQLKMWVDCEATVSWQPEIPKLMAPPTGVPPYHLCVCTPSAGARTCWPTTAKLQAAGDASQGSTYVMLSKSRKITVQLQVKASWRLDGKLVSLPQAGSDYEGLNALSKEMAALQWSQHETEGLNYEEVALLQKTFKPSPPALYLMPSGPGGVQSQAAGIFVIEGTNVLLGSAFAHGHPPQWWDLAKNLDRLDAVVLPDWSAASIQSYNFLAHFANTASVSTGYAWIGSIMVPPTDNSSGESVLVMSPSTSASFGDRQFTLPAGPTATSADRLPDRLRIFSKLGLGELYLQPLGAHVGTLVIWKPTKAAPIRLLLPAVAGVLHPVQSLSHVLKALRRVPEVCLEAKTAPSVSGGSTPRPATSVLHNSTSTAAPTKTAAKPLASSRLSSGLNHTTPRSTPASARTRTTTTATPTTTPGKTVNGTKKSPTSSGTPASAAATTKKPAAAAAATTTQVRSAPPAATRTIVKTATTTTAKAAPTPAPAKTTSRPSNGHARPSAAAAAAGTASAKASPRSTTEKTSAVKIGTKKTPVAPKTEARLNAHAARVQAKSKPSTPASTGDAPATTATTRSSPSDTVLKFAADGRPTNLPPRRKIGEKTVMEELAELPTTESKSSAAESPLLSPAAEAEQTKSPETSISAEVVSPARHEPDSLLSPAEEASAGVRSPHASANLNGEIEPNDVIGQKQHEEADLHPEEAHIEKDLGGLAEHKHAAHREDALQHEEESLESHEAHGHAIPDDLASGYRLEEEQHQHMVHSPEAFAHPDDHVIPHEMQRDFAAIPAHHDEADLHPEEAHLEKDISRLAEPEHATLPEDTLQHEEESLESHEAHGHAILDDLTSGYRVEEEQHQHMVHSPEAFAHPDDHVIPHEMQRDFAAIPAHHDEADLHHEEAHLEKDLTGLTETEHSLHPADTFQHEEESLESHEAHGHAILDDLTSGYRVEEEQHQHMIHSPEAFAHPDDHVVPHEMQRDFAAIPAHHDEADLHPEEAHLEKDLGRLAETEHATHPEDAFQHEEESLESHEAHGHAIPDDLTSGYRVEEEQHQHMVHSPEAFAHPDDHVIPHEMQRDFAAIPAHHDEADLHHEEAHLEKDLTGLTETEHSLHPADTFQHEEESLESHEAHGHAILDDLTSGYRVEEEQHQHMIHSPEAFAHPDDHVVPHEMQRDFAAIPAHHDEADLHPEEAHLEKDLGRLAETEHATHPEDAFQHEEESLESHEAHGHAIPDDLTSGYRVEEEQHQHMVHSPEAFAHPDDHVVPHEMQRDFAAIPAQHDEADLHSGEAHFEKDVSGLVETEHAAHPEDAFRHEEESHEAHGQAILDDLTSGYRVEEEQHQHMVHSPETFEHPDDHVIPHEMHNEFAAIPAQHDEADLHPEEAHFEKDVSGLAETEHADALRHEEESHEAHGHAILDDLTSGYRVEEEQHQHMVHSPEAFEHPDDHVIPHEMQRDFAAIPAHHDEADLHPEEAHFEKDVSGLAETEHADALRHEQESHEAHGQAILDDLTSGYRVEEEQHQHMVHSPEAFEHPDDHVVPHEMQRDFAAIPAHHDEADLHSGEAHFEKDVSGLVETEHAAHPEDAFHHEEESLESHEAHGHAIPDDLTSGYRLEEEQHQHMVHSPEAFEHPDDHVVPREMHHEFAAIPAHHDEADLHSEEAHLEKDLTGLTETEHAVHPGDTLAHDEKHLDSHEARSGFVEPHGHAISDDLASGYHAEEDQHQLMAHSPEAFEHLDDHVVPHEMHNEFAAIPAQHDEADLHSEEAHLEKDLTGWTETEHAVHPADNFQHAEDSLESHETHHGFLEPRGHAIPDDLTRGYRAEEDQHQLMAHSPEAFEHPDDHIIPHETEGTFVRRDLQEEADFEAEAARHFADVAGRHYDKEHQHKIQTPAPPVHEDDHATLHEAAPDLAAGSADHETSGGWGYVGDHATHVHGHLEEESRLQAPPAVVGVAPQEPIGELTGDIGHYSADPAYAADHPGTTFEGAGDPTVLSHEKTAYEATYQPSSTYTFEGGDLDQAHQHYYHGDVDAFGQVKAEAESSQWAAEDEESRQYYQQHHLNAGSLGKNEDEQLMSTETTRLLDPSMPPLHMENQFPVHSGLTDLQEEDYREHQQGGEGGYSPALGGGVTSTTSGAEFPYPSDPNALMPDGQPHQSSFLEDSAAAAAAVVADGQYVADSTTGTTAAATPDRPLVGLSPLGQVVTQEENQHSGSVEPPEDLSPTSDGSHDSVVHHDPTIIGSPEAYGFKLDVVTSSSAAAAATVTPAEAGASPDAADLSPNSAVPHPLAYRPHDLPTTTTAAGVAQEFAVPDGVSPASYNSDISSPAGIPTHHFGAAGGVLYETQRSNGYSHHEGDTNGQLESTTTDAAAAVAHPDFLRRPEDISLLLQAKKTPSSEAIHESEQAFDPLHSWGNPQGMPAPNPPHTRLSTPRTRTSTIPAKTGHSTATATPHAPETLPPGPPVYLDVIWVPGYIVRAPFDVAVTFFTQVRARCYILSGDSLHPLVGEALIAGISKWTAEEKAHVGSMGHAGLQGINVIPTDEPLDWVRWLRTNCGSTTVNETGEQRLQAAGIQVHPSATLCDIHFSDKGTEVTCQGTQISI